MSLGSLMSPDLITPNLMEGLIANTTNRVITKPNLFNRNNRGWIITPGVATQEVTTYRLKENLTNQVITVVSDATPTAAEVVTLLTTAFRANPILNGLFTVSGTTTLNLTARLPGADPNIYTFVDGGSTPTNTLNTSGGSIGVDSIDLPFGRCMTVDNLGNYNRLASGFSGTLEFAGVTGFTYADIETVLNRSVSGYPIDSSVNIVTDGVVCVWSDTAVDPTAAVYGVNTTGRFRSTADAAAVEITTGLVSWVEKTTAPGLTWLRINSGK